MIPLVIPAIAAAAGMAAKNYGKAADEYRGRRRKEQDPFEELQAMQAQQQQQGAAAGLSAYAAGRAAGAQPIAQSQPIVPGSQLPNGAQPAQLSSVQPQRPMQLDDPNMSAWESLRALRNY